MSTAPLPVRACVFDAYGTLFDLASAAEACRDVLGERVGAVSALWREKQIGYTWLRSLTGNYVDFWQVTGDALDYTLESLAIAEPGIRDRLMDCYRTLRCFPEVPDVLRQLRAAGFVTAILSNGSPRMLADATAAAGITDLFDHILSVDEVGVFKVHPRAYQLALDRLALPASAIAFQSSNGWDAYSAKAFGMRVVWCNRYGQRPERLPATPDRVVKTLTELPPLLARA